MQGSASANPGPLERNSILRSRWNILYQDITLSIVSDPGKYLTDQDADAYPTNEKNGCRSRWNFTHTKTKW